LKGVELMANKFSVRGSEKLRKIMGRTRGVFSSPKSEGARGFKSPSLQQAGSDLRHSLENPAKFARVRVLRSRQGTIDLVKFEAPAAPQSETGNVTTIDKTIYGRRVAVQIPGQTLDRKNLNMFQGYHKRMTSAWSRRA
jgi:hypothetical protein